MSSPPTTLGKYQIIREIARSNDIVYEAYDPLMNRRVALKELAVPPGSTPQQREDRIRRFLREAKAAGSLSHPNIMTVYEVGEDGSRHFIAMEFLDGHTLRNELDTHGSLAADRAIDIAIEICEGLDFAHKSGVVHRDIKPENIQLLSDGRIKLTDFGIARLTFEPNITMDGQVFGTPSYMSPEQVIGKDIDARSDLFSVGILLYEMVAGQKPFPGDSVVAITYAIMNKEPDQPPNVGYGLWQLLRKLLDKSPALRHSSAQELIEDLKAAKAGSDAVVFDPAQAQPQSQGGAYPPPAGNPYLTPYGTPMPTQMQPGMPYPYNPYQPMPAPGSLPPGQTTVPPGYQMPLPHYYPPQPRQPLIKPETKRFLARLVLVFGLLGSLVALVIVGIWSAGKVYERMQNEAHDKQVQASLSSIDTNLPLAERIRQSREAIAKLRDPAAVEQANRELAVLYKDQASMLLKEGNVSGAENALMTACAINDSNPDSHEALGDFYYEMATRGPDSKIRRDRYQAASLSYQYAAERQFDEVQSTIVKDKMAEASYRAALLSVQLGERENFLYDIDRAASAVVNSELKTKIERLKRQQDNEALLG